MSFAASLTSLLYFNSIKVRFELCKGSPESSTKPFQFHKGTIRTSICCVPAFFQVAYFNSIKVRLERSSQNWTYSHFPLFQFHKGTIRTHTRTSCVNSVSSYFNSIKVRLEPVLQVVILSVIFDFNSIKVRLELAFNVLTCWFSAISIP